MIYDQYYHASSKQYRFIMSHHIKCFKERKTSIIITTYSSVFGCLISPLWQVSYSASISACQKASLLGFTTLPPSDSAPPGWHDIFRLGDSGIPINLHGCHWNPGWEVDLTHVHISCIFVERIFLVGFVKGLFGCLGCLLISTDSLGTLWGDVG